MNRRRPNTRRRLRGIEQLQSRQLMAADIDLVDGVLQVQGTNFRDVIEIRFDDSDNIEVEIDSYDSNGNRVDGEFEQYDIEDVQAVIVQTLNGDDSVRIFHEDPTDQTEIDLVNQFDQFELHGGNGKDNFVNDTEVPIQAFGGANQDTIQGGSSHDQIFGGDGVDFLRGGAGNDLILGEGGTDYIYGQDGHDTLYGHNDNLSQSNAAAERDYIYGGLGQDVIRGGGGGDYLYGATNASDSADTHSNYLYGDDGNDLLIGGSQQDYLYGLNGIDDLRGRDGSDRLYGGNDGDFLYGEAGNDYLYGEGGLDTLRGGADNDRLDGGLDGLADALYGDGGADVFVRYGYTSPVYGWVTSETESEVDRIESLGDSITYRYGFIATILVPVLF